MKLNLVAFFLLEQVFTLLALNQSTEGDLYILENHPRGKRAILVNNEPNQPCRIYGHRYDILSMLLPLQINKNLHTKKHLVIQFR